MSVEFESHIDTVLSGTREALARAAEIIGGMAESNAKLKITDVVYSTPAGWYVRTGNLRNSITHSVEESGNKVTVVVGTNVEYAPYVELGTGIHAEGSQGRGVSWSYQDSKGNWHTTSGMKPRPYLRPAIEEHLEEYRNVLWLELSDSNIT